MADAIGAGGIPLAKMTKVYLKIKAERDRLSAEYKEADSELVSQQDKIRSALLGYLKENELKSVKTDAGTFYRTVKQKYWTSDWESMNAFIMEHDVPHFYEKRLNQTNVKQFLEENPDLVPKGLNVDSEYTVAVRKK